MKLKIFLCEIVYTFLPSITKAGIFISVDKRNSVSWCYELIIIILKTSIFNFYFLSAYLYGYHLRNYTLSQNLTTTMHT